jgi:hypothetical protein
MIHGLSKRYQLILWEAEGNDDESAAMRLDFDDRASALARLDAERSGVRYRTGLLMEWHKVSGVWELVERYEA